MAGTKFTPGGWFVESGSLRILSDDPRATIVCVVSGSPNNLQSIADARLIASAPDLLDALEMIVVAWEFGGVDEVDIKEARAAIAKAVGHD